MNEIDKSIDITGLFRITGLRPAPQNFTAEILSFLRGALVFGFEFKNISLPPEKRLTLEILGLAALEGSEE